MPHCLASSAVPHGATDTLVAGPGPPTPPATVVMVPGAPAPSMVGHAAVRDSACAAVPGPASVAAPASAAPSSPAVARLLRLMVQNPGMVLLLASPDPRW